MSQEMLQDAERKMKSAVEATAHDFQRIRTGRANPMVLEKITVDWPSQRPQTVVTDVPDDKLSIEIREDQP